jgi:hypothetical protein
MKEVMSCRARSSFVLAGLVATIAAISGCVSGPPVTTERRPDGVYHLRCKASLPACLDEAEKVCGHQHYAVLRAFDDHEYKGDATFPTEFRASEAFVRCGVRGSWGDENTDLRRQALCPEPAERVVVQAPRGCTPGVSQACVGPGGCAGGQVCAPDGTKFAPCDCGAPAAPPATP